MNFRSSSTLLPLFCVAPGLLALPQIARAQATSPKTALITSVNDGVATLGIGKMQGAVAGAVYSLGQGNNVARLQISQVRDGDSTAQLISASPGFILTVGDTGRFEKVEEMQKALAPLAPPATPHPTPVKNSETVGGEKASPKTAIVSGVSGNQVTLAIGLGDGTVAGAVYLLPAEGQTQAKIQIYKVNATDSQGMLYDAAKDFVPTVGDAARFWAVQPVREAPPSPPVAVVPPMPPVEVPSATNPSAPSPGTKPPGEALESGRITSVKGAAVTIAAGNQAGVIPKTNLPVMRGGAIIGLLRVQTANASSSTGTILWHDDTVAPIRVGDSLGLVGNSLSNTGEGMVMASGSASPAVGVPVAFETGASNAVVPKDDKSYELLASLAARGLIKSQPAAVFADNGIRRHNVSEDITFTRAQIAGFVLEAIGNDSGSEQRNAGLVQLVKEYRPELIKIGATKGTLAAYLPKGFLLSVSGQESITGIAGDRPPATGLAGVGFGDRYGATRTTSGIDSRTDITGQFNNKLSFFAEVDAGSKLNEDNSNDAVTVRNAYITYDAQRQIRGLTLEMGRKEYWWGVGHFGTTLLGDASGGLDSFHATFKRGSYQFESLYAPLGTGPAGGKRALYGQNLKVSIGSQFHFGLADTLLTPKHDFNPLLFLASNTPISLYTADKKVKNEQDNTLLQAYIESDMARGITTYGEFLVDDYAANGHNPIANRDGSLVGLHLYTPKDPARLGMYVEYAKLNGGTYLARESMGTRDPDYFYNYRNASLGYPISPIYQGDNFNGGAESLRLEGYWKATHNLRLNAGIEFSDINSEDQNMANLGVLPLGYSRQQNFRVAAAYDVSRSFTVTARAQRISTNQPNFLVGEPTLNLYQYSLELSRAF